MKPVEPEVRAKPELKPEGSDIIFTNTKNKVLAAVVDANKDGKITRAELETARKALDKDGDGIISRAELVAAIKDKRIQGANIQKINQAAELISAAGGMIADDKVIVVGGKAASPAANRAMAAIEELAAKAGVGEKDGKVTRAELDAARKALDKDGDGIISPSEAAALSGGKDMQRLAAQTINEDAARKAVEARVALDAAVKSFDKDNNGKLDPKEAADALKAMDKDGNGKVSKEEMAEALAKKAGIPVGNPADLLKDKAMAAALAQLGGALQKAGVAVDASGSMKVSSENAPGEDKTAGRKI